MFNLENLLVKPNKIKVSAAKPEEIGHPELFTCNGRKLDRMHIPDVSPEEYQEYAKKYALSPKFSPENAKLETASSYYIRKARIEKLARILGTEPKNIDVTDYVWDERYYTEYSFMWNVYCVDESYRDNSDDNRYKKANEVYIGQDPRTARIDEDLWNQLYRLCTRAIAKRYAMLMTEVDKCLGFLMSVLEYTDGFRTNATAFQVATLTKFANFFKKLLTDKEFAEYIKSTNDIEVFAKSELTHSDYVDTYRALCKLLIHGTDQDMEFFRGLLQTTEDPYLEEIVDPDRANPLDSVEQYYEDSESSEEEEDVDEVG